MTESEVEQFAIDYFRGLGYSYRFGPNIAPDTPNAERTSYTDTFLPGRLLSALKSLNPGMPSDAIEEAFKKVIRSSAPTLTGQNHEFHNQLRDGIDVAFRKDENIAYEKVRLIDFENPEANDWLVVNQFTIIDGQHNRRPDILVFVNGLPLAIFELKNPADENATIWAALNQIQTYKKEIPGLFAFNEVIVLSDGPQARIGSLTSDKERFVAWKTVEGEDLAPATKTQLEVLIKGLFEKKRFLDFIRFFIVFERTRQQSFIKKIAAYHQYHAVNKAVISTLKAAGPKGDRRIGVIWHTQGSGKSLSMVFFAGKIILEHDLENPTIVVITDRNDLDGQLFDTFSNCFELLRQTPVQAKDREDLRRLLKVASGGVIFSTIQKFFPEERLGKMDALSERKNIIVIADEAHRTQYDFVDGFAKHLHDALPKASFVGFTGTPLELSDKNTQAVFGNYISIYDIERSVADGATVPIYYESRLARLKLEENEKPHVDPAFEDLTENEEERDKQKLKTKWAALEALVGAEKRIGLIAEDFVDHWAKRLEVMDGKAMFVCMSRRICVELYQQIVKLRPDWHDEEDSKGIIKVVMTGSATDPLNWQEHIRGKARRDELADRFRDPDDPFQIVIVRDMWLTGFDAPCLTTMYVDKPMKGHGLMQTIARVNRVFKDKPGGLIVDYIGLADSLKSALMTYTNSGGRGTAGVDQEEAVAVMLEKHEVVSEMFHGFDWSIWHTGSTHQKLGLVPGAQQHILSQDDGKKRYLKAVTELSQAFALSVPHDATIKIRDDVAFFQLIRAQLIKSRSDDEHGKSPEEVDHALRQLVSKAISSDGVLDIFSAAGLKRPDISILTEEFLAEVRGMPQKNLAVELLQKLLKSEINSPSNRRNVIQTKSFLEMLELSLKRYESRAVETAKIIEELIELARKMREAQQRGEELGLTEDEIAFYDALETNDSAVKVLGDAALKTIAQELVKKLKSNLKVDWTQRDSVRAQIRLDIKKILKHYGYPPDKQEKATTTVIEQAEELYRDWVA